MPAPLSMVELKVAEHSSKKHTDVVTGLSWSSTNELLTVGDDKQVCAPVATSDAIGALRSAAHWLRERVPGWPTYGSITPP